MGAVASRPLVLDRLARTCNGAAVQRAWFALLIGLGCAHAGEEPGVASAPPTEVDLAAPVSTEGLAAPVPEPVPAPAPAAEAVPPPVDLTRLDEPFASEPSEPSPPTLAVGVPGGVMGPAVGTPPGPLPAPPPKPTLVPGSMQCSFPKDVDPDVDAARVVLRVSVDALGAVTKILVLADPGHGFGRAARDCIAHARFVAARDEQARPVPGDTTLTVRFQR